MVIGDGEERATLESLARELGIASRIHFVGERHGVEVSEFFLLGRFAVLPDALLLDLAVDFVILRAFPAFAVVLEALRLPPRPSDIPIKTPLARVAKFCVSRCAVLKLVSRCARIAAWARFA